MFPPCAPFLSTGETMFPLWDPFFLVQEGDCRSDSSVRGCSHATLAEARAKPAPPSQEQELEPASELSVDVEQAVGDSARVVDLLDVGAARGAGLSPLRR